MKTLLPGVALLFGFAIMAHADEAEERRLRSIAVLESEGVPYIEWLPQIETQFQSLRRPQDEVLERAVALVIVAVYAETGDAQLRDVLISDFAAQSSFTSDEIAFLRGRSSIPEAEVQFIWRYEAAAILLWALGFDVVPERPDQIVEVSDISELFVSEGPEGLRQRAALRPQSELLDAADLIYRYHWAVRQARLDRQPAPAGLDPGVVYERHYALNWLIGSSALDWDEVTTDT